MAYALACFGLVALLQGIAWSARAARTPPSTRRERARDVGGMLLAPFGLGLLGLGLLLALVPDFF